MSCEEEVGGLMESVSRLLVKVVESEGLPTLVTIARCVCVYSMTRDLLKVLSMW